MSRRAGFFLFAFFQSLYALTASGNIFRVPDEFESYFQVEHFVDAGDLSVPQTLTLQRPVVENGRVIYGNLFFGKVAADGKPYAPYGPLSSLLALGHHAAARGLAWVLGIERRPPPDAMGWLYFVAGLTSLATSTAAALAVLGFYRASLALGSSPRMALQLSCVVGGATVLWPYGTVFFSEAFLAAAFVWAAALLLEARSGRSAGWRSAGAAVLLGVAGLTKPTALVVAPAFIAAVLAEPGLANRFRIALLLAVGAGAAGMFHAVWNFQRFGHPMDFGYDWAETIPTVPYRPFALDELPRGLFVLLLSPGKSLFVWAPALFLVLFRMRSLWESHRGLAVGLLVSAVTGLLFYGAYMFPEGGYAHGPRHLVPIIPLLLLPLANPDAPRIRRAPFVACAVAGAVVAMLSVSVSYLEDQALGIQAGTQAQYYERIDPAPGRPWNRFDVNYVPFVKAMTVRGWWTMPALGRGPDFLPRLLSAVRRTAGGGGDIPAWFPAAYLLLWGGAGSLAGLGLWRARASLDPSLPPQTSSATS